MKCPVLPALEVMINCTCLYETSIRSEVAEDMFPDPLLAYWLTN